MTRYLRIVLPALALAGCGDSTPMGTDMAGGKTDMSMNTADLTMGPDMAGPPAAPMLGMQLERMGRPTINVAVTNPFDLDSMQQQTRDKYNQDSDPSKWAATWTPVLAGTLGLYDGVDTVCGNQVGACGMLAGCGVAMPAKGRYDTLGGVLADDKLYLDSSKATCGAYLAVETAVLGLPNNECGGRTPLFNVVHETYTAAAVGVAGFMGNDTYAVTDGVAKETDGTVSLTTFPFLDAPK